MMAAAWLFIRSNWKAAAVAAAGIALILVIIGYGAHERSIQKAADQVVLDAVKADLRQCHLNAATLSQAVAAQNASVDAMKADSDRRARMLADGLQQAREGRASAEARAARLLRPVPGVDACARAVAARAAVLGSLN